MIQTSLKTTEGKDTYCEKHKWAIHTQYEDMIHIHCTVCNLEIEIYSDHLWMWDYTKEGVSSILPLAHTSDLVMLDGANLTKVAEKK